MNGGREERWESDENPRAPADQRVPGLLRTTLGGKSWALLNMRETGGRKKQFHCNSLCSGFRSPYSANRRGHLGRYVIAEVEELWYYRV